MKNALGDSADAATAAAFSDTSRFAAAVPTLKPSVRVGYALFAHTSEFLFRVSSPLNPNPSVLNPNPPPLPPNHGSCATRSNPEVVIGFRERRDSLLFSRDESESSSPVETASAVVSFSPNAFF